MDARYRPIIICSAWAAIIRVVKVCTERSFRSRRFVHKHFFLSPFFLTFIFYFLGSRLIWEHVPRHAQTVWCIWQEASATRRCRLTTVCAIRTRHEHVHIEERHWDGPIDKDESPTLQICFQYLPERGFFPPSPTRTSLNRSLISFSWPTASSVSVCLSCKKAFIRQLFCQCPPTLFYYLTFCSKTRRFSFLFIWPFLRQLSLLWSWHHSTRRATKSLGIWGLLATTSFIFLHGIGRSRNDQSFWLCISSIR